MLTLVIRSFMEAKKLIQKDRVHFDYFISIGGLTEYMQTEALVQSASKRGINSIAMFFDDINEEEDGLVPPTLKEVSRVLMVSREVGLDSEKSILINCQAGISRSTAIGYILLCDVFGAGNEYMAYKWIKEIRPFCYPNRLVVKLGDELLKREGQMILTSQEFYK